jgi:hypothetical protein
LDKPINWTLLTDITDPTMQEFKFWQDCESILLIIMRLARDKLCVKLLNKYYDQCLIYSIYSDYRNNCFHYKKKCEDYAKTLPPQKTNYLCRKHACNVNLMPLLYEVCESKVKQDL